jgi:hypothetical protein
MSDLNDTIGEAVEHGRESKINSRVAIFVAITATFMAICNIKDGNIVQAMAQAQARSIDTWSYFQAKSTKESIAANTLDMLKVENASSNADVTRKLEEKINGYEKEKAQIKTEAEGYQKQYDDLNVFDDQFDMTEALLSISISLFGVTALTQKKWLLYFGSAVCIVGFILGLTAFMKISLHSDFVSRILG